jgi:hypothetical protein
MQSVFLTSTSRENTGAGPSKQTVFFEADTTTEAELHSKVRNFAFQRGQKGALLGHSAKPFVVFAGVFSLRCKQDWTTDWPNWSPEPSEIAIGL